ncbi:MAG: sulfatase-like hydrolase/transferase [Burkholderiales bacterium]|nr:sulfatase-like hydrolase/transferase [Burkholderiales bacterium]
MKFPGHVDRIGRSDILKNMATNRISKFLITALTYLCGISCIINAGWVNAGDKPHIIYIMANDLGWRDLGFHGGRAPTPHIDALSGSGARLEGFYTLPHSSSTRAALLTGRYPYRFGLQTNSILSWSTYGIPQGERLLSQALNLAGYRTALLGSWLLGHAKRSHLPTQRGFDYFYGSLTPTGDHLKKINTIGLNDWFEGEKQITEFGYATDLISKKSTTLIEEHDQTIPLFMLINFPTPGMPLQAPHNLVTKFNQFEDQATQTYLAMVSQIDAAVGKIIIALDKKGIRQDTVIIFHSDNGGSVKRKYLSGDGDSKKTVSDNGPFRSGSGSLYEGGVRVPAIVSWPGKIKPAISTERVHVLDLYVTLLEFAGASTSKNDQVKPVDGISISPLLFENKLLPKRTLVLNVTELGGAILRDNWKLILVSTLPSQRELYDIENDPSEEINVVSKYPEIADELTDALLEASWEMTPSLYLKDLSNARNHYTPMIWSENPQRP